MASGEARWVEGPREGREAFLVVAATVWVQKMIWMVLFILHVAAQAWWLIALAGITRRRGLPGREPAWGLATALGTGYPILAVCTGVPLLLGQASAWRLWLVVCVVPGLVQTMLFWLTWRRWAPPLLVLLGGPVALIASAALGANSPFETGLVGVVAGWYLVTVLGTLLWAGALPVPDPAAEPTECPKCGYSYAGLREGAPRPECGEPRRRGPYSRPEPAPDAERTQ